MKSECDHIRDLIADSFTEILASEQAKRLEEHLRECADCRSYATALKQEDLLLAQLVAGVATNMPGRQEQLVQALGRRQFRPAGHPTKWRRIMRSRIAGLAAAAIVVLVATLGISLLEKSSTPAYGMTEALDLIEQARTLHIQGWRIDQRGSPSEEVKLPFERWYDLENGRYRLEHTNLGFGDEVSPGFVVCDGEYIMRTGAYQPVGDRVHRTIDFEKVDPNRRSDIGWLEWYQQLRRIEGFQKSRQDTINGERFDVWEGEYTYGVGDHVARHRLQVWLSPATAALGAIKAWEEQGENEWRQTTEYTKFERNVPLPPELFRTEPPASGYEIHTSKEAATVPARRSLLEHDIYENTEFGYAPLNYWVAPVFVLANGVFLAGYRSVDAQEPQDQSEYFEGLQVGGPLAKLPVEVFVLSPEPNVRNVLFMGFHLAHTRTQTAKGPRWYEWVLYVPDGEPPEPDAVLMYRIQYRLNVQRTQDVDISVKQTAIPDPRRIATEEDFNRLVLDAIAERSDGGVVPEQVTYEHVLRLAEEIRASIAR